jgi:hypothetical protein
MGTLAYQNTASPVENLIAVLDFLSKTAGAPDGDASTGFEVNGATIDYFNYSNPSTGEEKIGVDIRHNNGLVLYHCMRYRGALPQLAEVRESSLCKDQYGPDEMGNYTLICYQEQTMEFEIERIIDYCISVLIPETSKVA